jgi:nucleoside-diphosphate-sugar epimerase
MYLKKQAFNLHPLKKYQRGISFAVQLTLSRYFRPSEVETLLGDPSKAQNKLGWMPEISVQEMCAEMIQEDLKVAIRTRLLREHGYHVSTAGEG